jgi:hypothetical protein
MENKTGLITGVVMVLVFVAGFGLGYVTATPYMNEGEDAQEENVIENFFDRSSDAADTNSNTESSVADSVPSEGTTLDASVMTDGQRKLLESLGVDADSITITPQMIACAESSLGSERVGEIQNGATPSFVEGTKLMACYTAG